MQNVCLRETHLSQERLKTECVGQSETLQDLMDLRHTILKYKHREHCWRWIGVLVTSGPDIVGCCGCGEGLVVMMIVMMMVVLVMVAHLIDKKSQMFQLLGWEVTWLDWLFEDSVHQEGKTGQGACVQSPEKLNSILKVYCSCM